MADPRVPETDDELHELLRGALEGLDLTSEIEPVPAGVTEGSLWVHDFVTADAELAAVVVDSAVDELAGVRGSASVRSISFATDDLEIDIEISLLAGDRRRLAGLVVPAVAGSVRLAIGGERVDVDLDERGRFVFDDVPVGTAMITMELDGTPIRLDAFVL